MVFGILKCEGYVVTEIAPNASNKQIQQVIRSRVDIDNVIHSDGWRAYNGLVKVGYENTTECILVRLNFLGKCLYQRYST